MQCKQHWVNMTVPGCIGDKVALRNSESKTLQFGKMHSWYTIEKTVAIIINACHDHALYKPFGGSRRQELPDSSDHAGDSRLIQKSRNPGVGTRSCFGPLNHS